MSAKFVKGCFFNCRSRTFLVYHLHSPVKQIFGKDGIHASIKEDTLLYSKPDEKLEYYPMNVSKKRNN